MELKIEVYNSEELNATADYLKQIASIRDNSGDVQRMVFEYKAASEQPKETAQPAAEPTSDEKPKRKRRTKAEMVAEIEAKAEEAPLISAEPENRVNPEDEALDAADEAFETEEIKETVAPLTHDDVRRVLNEYVALYGLDKAQIDAPVVLKEIFGAECSKISDIPDTQESLEKAIAAIKHLINSNPFGREAV